MADLVPTSITTSIAALLLAAALLALGVIDIRERRLPDRLTLPLVAAGLVWALWQGQSWLAHVAGAGLGYAFLVAVELGHRRLTGRNGLGRGDAKLFAAGGAWCGVFALPVILLIASAAALIWLSIRGTFTGQRVDRYTSIAFGPFLAAAIFTAWLASPVILAGI